MPNIHLSFVNQFNKVIRYISALFVLIFVLTACGQKGPLYLPDSTDDDLTGKNSLTEQ